jgi:hypothetical protein
MFSRWIVTNITFARGTLHCRKTRILCGDNRDLWTAITEKALGLHNTNKKTNTYALSGT